MDLRQVRTYVISPGTGKFGQRLRDTLDRLRRIGFQNVEHVPSVPDESATNSLSRTNLLIFEKEKDRDTPFLVVEDDIQIDDFPTTENMWHITIPKDAVAVYLGVSKWVYPHEYHTLSCGKHIRRMTPMDHIPHDDHLVRIRGMTSTHAILFLDHHFLQTISLCVRSHLPLRTPHDLVMATLQQHYKMYALKKPLFYQDLQQGGQQAETRLIWQDDQYYPRV